jgi:hypothetical protein
LSPQQHEYLPDNNITQALTNTSPLPLSVLFIELYL